MFNYDQEKERALELLKFYGDTVQFVKKGNTSSYDDDGNPIPPEPNVTLDGTATPLVQFKSHEIDGKRILANDGYLIFQGDSGDPFIGMVVTISNSTYRVVGNSPLKSISGITLFSKVHLRSGS